MKALETSGGAAFHLDWLRSPAQRHHEVDFRLRVFRVALPPVRFAYAECGRDFLRDELLGKRAIVNGKKTPLMQGLVNRPSRHRLLSNGDSNRKFKIDLPMVFRFSRTSRSSASLKIGWGDFLVLE